MIEARMFSVFFFHSLEQGSKFPSQTQPQEAEQKKTVVDHPAMPSEASIPRCWKVRAGSLRWANCHCFTKSTRHLHKPCPTSLSGTCMTFIQKFEIVRIHIFLLSTVFRLKVTIHDIHAIHEIVHTVLRCLTPSRFALPHALWIGPKQV